MGLFSGAKDWRALGQSLGLTAYQPTASYYYGASFRQLKRSLGIPAADLRASFDHWHYGTWRGAEVMIVVFSGSGITHTGVIVRVDPPLFLGLGINPKCDPPFYGRAPTGFAAIDDHLQVEGFDLGRVIMLLAPSEFVGKELLRRIARCATALHISDSLITFVNDGHETDLAKIEWQLEFALSIASTLAMRRPTLPLTADEIAQRAEWQHFADSVGVTFDPRRMTLFGTFEGTSIKIALETEVQQIRTSVNVRFPRNVHVAFTAKRTTTPGFLQGTFGQDITIGDEPFDELFQVTGHPELAVRELLNKPDLLRVMSRLGAATTEVQLNEEQLFFRVVGPTMSGELLGSICETARVTSASLFGQLQKIAPYR